MIVHTLLPIKVSFRRARRAVVWLPMWCAMLLTIGTAALQEPQTNQLPQVVERPEYAIHRAVAEGWSAKVVALLERGVALDLLVPQEVNDHDLPSGTTPLMLAAWHGRTEIAKLLLAHGADVNQAGDIAVTSLMIATYKGHLDVVRLLLEAGADPSLRDEFGAAILHFAAGSGSIEMLEFWIDRGADLNAQRFETKETPLTVAAVNSNPELFVHLLESGANPDLADHDERTAVHYVVAYFMMPASHLELLSEAGANLSNPYPRSGETPLHIAVTTRRSDPEYFLTLLSLQPVVDHPDLYGQTPLYRVVEGLSGYFRHVPAESGEMIVRDLVSAGAEINRKDNRGNTPIVEAARWCDVQLLDLLVELGANWDVQDEKGRTLAEIAQQRGKQKVIGMRRPGENCEAFLQRIDELSRK